MKDALSVLAYVPLHGVGTVYLESFVSLLHRIAQMYRVRTVSLVRLLAALETGRGYQPQNVDSQVRLLGHSDFAVRMVSALDTLEGRAQESRRAVTGTLLPLRGVLSRNGVGLFSKESRWCPECLDPDRGTGYGLLAHELLRILHCPLHGAVLIESCTVCGTVRRPIPDSSSGRYCRVCGDKLWLQSGRPTDQDDYARWAEQQTLALVELVASPDRTIPAENWFREFSEGLAALNSSPRKEYSDKERKFFRYVAKQPRFANAEPLPRWETLLRVAALQSISATDLIQYPKQSFTLRLLPSGELPFKPAGRVNTSSVRSLAFENLLRRLLETPEDNTLPSVNNLKTLERLALNNDFFRNSKVLDQYRKEQIRRKTVQRCVSYGRAFEAALKIVDACQREGREAQIRLDGATITKRHGVAKAVAESAMNAALTYRQSAAQS